MELKIMPDPLSSTASGILAKIAAAPLFKLLVYLIGPTMAAIVVMLMTQPRTPAQWASALFSTVMTSFALGAYVITNHINLAHIDTMLGMMQVGGIFFFCGLPGWIIVRSVFLYAEATHDKTILQIIKELKETFTK